jgi:hypothetical protein
MLSHINTLPQGGYFPENTRFVGIGMELIRLTEEEKRKVIREKIFNCYKECKMPLGVELSNLFKRLESHFGRLNNIPEEFLKPSILRMLCECADDSVCPILGFLSHDVTAEHEKCPPLGIIEPTINQDALLNLTYYFPVLVKVKKLEPVFKKISKQYQKSYIKEPDSLWRLVKLVGLKVMRLPPFEWVELALDELIQNDIYPTKPKRLGAPFKRMRDKEILQLYILFRKFCYAEVPEKYEPPKGDTTWLKKFIKEENRLDDFYKICQEEYGLSRKRVDNIISRYFKRKTLKGFIEIPEVLFLFDDDLYRLHLS